MRRCPAKRSGPLIHVILILEELTAVNVSLMYCLENTSTLLSTDVDQRCATCGEDLFSAGGGYGLLVAGLNGPTRISGRTLNTRSPGCCVSANPLSGSRLGIRCGANRGSPHV